MFGINSFEQVGQIAQGHFNEITKREQELSKSRLVICRQCPLYKEGPLGPICDASKCLDTKTNTIVSYPGKGIVCGCGCRLQAKTTLKGAKCVLNKW